MPTSWVTLAAALESPQGSTSYALLVLLLLLAASLWLLQRAKPHRLARSMIFTLAVLMALRLVEVVVFVYAWSGSPAALQAMAPLERGLHLITLLALAWIWSQPVEGERYARMNFAIALLAALLLAGVIFTPWLSNPPAASFNYSDADYAWGAACFAALLFALVRMVKARLIAGLIVFGILLLGQTAQLLLAEPFGNLPLATQAAHLLVLPLLSMLPRRATASQSAEDFAAQEAFAETFEPEAEGEITQQEDEIEFFDFDESGEQAPPAASAFALASRIAAEFGADLCVFITIHEERDEFRLAAGYNVVRDAPIEPSSLPLGDLPRLRLALQSKQALLLSTEERMPELGVISKALRLSFQAHLLALPLQIQGTSPWGLLLLSLEQAWQPEDELKLVSSSIELSARLAAALGLQPSVAPEQAEVETILEEETIGDERDRSDIERLLIQNEALASPEPLVSGNELVQGLQIENERLRSAVSALEASAAAPLSTASDQEVQQAKEELRLALEEVARLHEQLDLARKSAPVSEPGESAAKPMTSHQVEVIASIAQELRQPLSSIVGYTDLLLGESVGILGALQRKFLERVRSSSERMNSLIDNLIRIAELDQAGYSATRKPVDLSAVIDDAIGLLRTQLQEKRIVLRVDLPDHLPELNTDRDALQQILFHLLQNADAATPAEGELTLRAILDYQKELGDFVLIQVSDSGGGIPEEDLPRVFSRVYRANNPVITGVGDTGVGLSIAETLTQALGGRIWVDSEAGVGATFSVLLPVNP